MWDIRTTRVVVSRDVIWLKRMFFKEDASGVIDLEALDDIEDDLASELGSENKNDECPSNNNRISREAECHGRVRLLQDLVKHAGRILDVQSRLRTG